MRETPTGNERPCRDLGKSTVVEVAPEEFAGTEDLFRLLQLDDPPVARWRLAEELQPGEEVPQAFRRQVPVPIEFRVIDVGVDDPFPEGNDVLFVELLPGVKPPYRVSVTDIDGDECAAFGNDPVEHVRVVGERCGKIFQRHGDAMPVAVFDEERKVVDGAKQIDPCAGRVVEPDVNGHVPSARQGHLFHGPLQQRQGVVTPPVGKSHIHVGETAVVADIETGKPPHERDEFICRLIGVDRPVNGRKPYREANSVSRSAS